MLKVDVVQLRGDSFTIGKEIGKTLIDKPIVNVFEQITKPEVNIRDVESLFTIYSPHLLEEIKGIAEGMEISYEKAAALFSGYDLPRVQAMGCSAVITTDYYVRNYDFSPDFYDGVFVMAQPHSGLASAGYSLQAIGRHDGVNEAGLVVGLHFVSNEGYKTGISAWTSNRIVLDNCSSVEDAIHLLKEIPHAACYNFSLADAKDVIAVVEASPDKVLVRSDPEYLSCVNHFQVEELVSKNRKAIDGSLQRNIYMQGLKNDGQDVEEMFTIFSEPTSPLFYTHYDQLFGTLHTFAYARKNSRILTTIARGEQIMDISFSDWVNGMNIPMTTMNGMCKE
ncbi:C45 family autoproteolytic acyltransferase/hydrolase [Fredinandcohnia humi]